jgi:hypothetical protein
MVEKHNLHLRMEEATKTDLYPTMHMLILCRKWRLLANLYNRGRYLNQTALNPILQGINKTR